MKEKEPLVKSKDYGQDEASAKVCICAYSMHVYVYACIYMVTTDRNDSLHQIPLHVYQVYTHNHYI